MSSRWRTRLASRLPGRISSASVMCTGPTCRLDWEQVQPLHLNAAQTVQIAELAPTVDGKPDLTKIAAIELERLAREFRTQRIIFETARDVYDQMQQTWQGWQGVSAGSTGASDRTVHPFRPHPPHPGPVPSGRSEKTPAHQPEYDQGWSSISGRRFVFENTDKLEPVFDQDHPIRSTGDMVQWYTGRPCAYTARSHINFCVYDSTWEASEAFELDHNSVVAAWVKNEHLGFEVFYVHHGVVRKYRPDFLIRLRSGKMLALETKGRGQRFRTGPNVGFWTNGHVRSTNTAASGAGPGTCRRTPAISRIFWSGTRSEAA